MESVERYVEFQKIDKRFVGVHALRDISFRANGGEVCALLGENGAGKSTLLKIMSGAQTPDSGKILLNGEEVVFHSTQDAIAAGVSIIYQERQLLKDLSVTENIFMDFLPRGRFGIVDFAAAHAEAQRIIDEFKIPIKATANVGTLSVAHQQMVEIMKAYRRNSRVIAFDEPTASLSDVEIDVLFDVISRLRDEGKVILYVSHRLKELFQITDRIVILKDGGFVKSLVTKEATEPELIRLMVGRDLGDIFDNLARNTEQGDIVLEVKDLTNEKVKGVSFQLHKGEVLGFSGLVGAGRSEIMRAIFGVDAIESGEVLIDGAPVHIKSPRDAIDAGIGLCPEDRKEEGLVLERTIRENTTIPILNTIAEKGLINLSKERAIAANSIKNYNIKTHSMEKIVMELSGGNQQKVILGRWMSADLKVLILDEPTKGIDVGAKSEIYQMVCDLAKKGLGIIFISSELPEVLNVADKIVVICDGQITGILDREEATEEKVLALAMHEHRAAS
ncbi:MAG: sugar ABC transporter ATP-binding protein [Clostridiales Family XIII bacterium]|jgi:ABC-type sugar transport system ATPase subunit|nr:sugar ABC transporter ATP-binding protein [Clostridiales Family XIII bacterium]